MQILQHKIFRWCILLGYIGLVFWLCLMPESDLPKNPFLSKIHFDKWVHLMMHFGMWTLIVWTYKGAGHLSKNRNFIFLFSILLTLVIGIVIEYLQQYVGRSHADWGDVTANLLGAFIAWRIWLRLEHRWTFYKW